MSDASITEVSIRPAENGFVIWVYGGKDGLRPYIATDIDRLADVLHRIFPRALPVNPPEPKPAIIQVRVPPMYAPPPFVRHTSADTVAAQNDVSVKAKQEAIRG